LDNLARRVRDEAYLNSATGSTVELASERVADDDVAVYGERQNEQRTEMLRQEVQDVEQLADDGRVVQVHVELELEGVERVDDEEDDGGDGQRSHVDRRRVVPPHSTLQPDHRRQNVADQADEQPHGKDDPVEPDGVRDEVQYEL